MENKIIGKSGQRKRPEEFASIVPDLVPWAKGSRYNRIFSGIYPKGKGPNMTWNAKEQFLFVAGKFSKNSLSTDLLFRWGQWMTWPETHGMGMIESERDASCQNPLDVLSYSARSSKISINTESFWVQCPTFITPLSPGLTWAPKAQGEWVWLSLTPNLWYL